MVISLTLVYDVKTNKNNKNFIKCILIQVLLMVWEKIHMLHSKEYQPTVDIYLEHRKFNKNKWINKSIFINIFGVYIYKHTVCEM